VVDEPRRPRGENALQRRQRAGWLAPAAFSSGDFSYSAGIRAKDISLQGVIHELAAPRPTYQPSILKLLDLVRHRGLPDIVLAAELSTWHCSDDRVPPWEVTSYSG
jgi:hypothetical protein